MEFYSSEEGFLEELLGNYSNQDLSSTNLDVFSSYNIKSSFPAHTCFHNYNQPIDEALNGSFYGAASFRDELSLADFANIDSQTLPYYSQPPDYCSVSNFDGARVPDSVIGAPCKVEAVPELSTTFNMGFSNESVRKKKVNGQPSKNLMAERRRRKRLNDRLAMLRSVVPKISKMDRTSILGDTIDYMKEVQERINSLQVEMDLGANELGLLSMFENVKPEEILIRNSHKFNVEKKSNSETRIEMCCAGKPGLLLSTVTALEALGMDIQHCVISCFNDFSMQASCSQKAGQRVLESKDIKEALFRNAGYGGRCL